MKGHDEWQGLRHELDRFYAFGFGRSTQHRFLHEPHPRLSMRTPVDILADGNDGIAQVRSAVLHTLARYKA